LSNTFISWEERTNGVISSNDNHATDYISEDQYFCGWSVHVWLHYAPVTIFSSLEKNILLLLMSSWVTLRPCSFLPDWWVGTILDRIASLIYINFD
jgi:hypothetical protein